MNPQSAGEPKIARARLADRLRSLHEAWKAHEEREGRKPLTLKQLKITLSLGVSTQMLQLWQTGAQHAPSEESLRDYRALIDYYQERAPAPHLSLKEWELLIREAMAERLRTTGGRPPSVSRPARVAPFRYCHTGEGDRPPVLTGRETELDQLQELIRRGPAYMTLVAPPWAGKTAFLATFATTRTSDDIDLVAYFVRRGRGTDSADFLTTMVRELGRHVGRKRLGRADRATLLTLYEEAAATSSARGRILLLVVDGLDEDARKEIEEQSIASLLPPQPYPGLRVLASRRWHPPLPGDVPLDHPLRIAEQIPRFRPSPEAGVLRSTAMNDLAALFRAPEGWMREIIGYLALASGGLSHNDLIELMSRGEHGPAPIPFELQDRLHSVAGRVLGPEDLEPDTFVLAHEELYGAAAEGLGPGTLAELTERLHAWADTYKASGWPDATPTYLLHHYQKLLKGAGDLDRCITYALDHRRLRRLADRGRTDLALASLDHITQAAPTPTVLASAAASRSLLEAEGRVVPREALRALVVAGDLARARSLALSPVDPASKAVRLLEVVQALLPAETPRRAAQATGLAREAAAWAERAQQQNQVPTATAELETLAIAPRVACVLAAVGLPDEAMRLLTTVDPCRPDNIAAVAEAAALLRVSSPNFADRLLDELLLEAESQAESEEGQPVFAVEIWAAVARATPQRAEPIHRRMKEFSKELTVDSSGRAAIDCCAITASALATAMPDEARELAEKAQRGAQEALGVVPDDVLRESLARVAQALLDIGESPKKAHALLASAPSEVTYQVALLLDNAPDEENKSPEAAEARETEELLRDMRSLSGLGDGPQLRHSLDRFTRRTGRQSTLVMWLPFLSEALPGVVDDILEAASLLEPDLSDTTPLQVRVLTSAALAHADAQRHDKALHCAQRAAGVAQRMAATQPPEIRALVAQAFAHAGDTERAREWAAPRQGRKPLGKAGIPYRRAALAIEMGLNPEGLVAHTITDGLPKARINASGVDLLKVLRGHAAGAQTAAQVASLESTARARLDTEPLLSAGLALLHAVFGDTERACGTIARLTDPAVRGVAQASVATYLAGVPTHLDVAGDENYWTLSVLRVLAHHMSPPAPGDTAAVVNLTLETLSTSSWYRALPVMSHTNPETLFKVADVLHQHGQLRRTKS